MSLKHRLHRIKSRHKFAALGLVAAAMVATPMVPVLNLQGAAVDALLRETAALDPVSGAIALQWGLIAHRDLAGLVLRGVGQLEGERALRAVEVDQRIQTLHTALQAVRLLPAIGEARALQADWSALLPRIQQRQIGWAESDAAHRLLVEQTLQVVDLVAAAAPSDDLGGGPGTAPLLSVAGLGGLARLAAATAEVAAAGSPATTGRQADAARDRLQQRLALLRYAGRRAAEGPALADALHAATLATERLLVASTHDGRPDAAGAAAAVAAQAKLFNVAHDAARRGIGARLADAERLRSALLAAMTVLAAAAGALLVALRRAWPAADDTNGDDAAAYRPAALPAAALNRRIEPEPRPREAVAALWLRLRHRRTGGPDTDLSPGANASVRAAGATAGQDTQPAAMTTAFRRPASTSEGC